jgi:hypothetical protein
MSTRHTFAETLVAMPPEIRARQERKKIMWATDCIHARKYGPDLWCNKAPYHDCLCKIDRCKPCNEEELPRKNDGSQAAQTTNK